VIEDLVAQLPRLAHQAAFGAVAAVGFGVLFNFGWRRLVWCAAAGALALGVRTYCQDLRWSLEAASFAAAIATSCAAILLKRPIGTACHAVALAGCIPMVPGAFFGQALLGFFALTAPDPANALDTINLSTQAMLRVIFTLGAIGAGLTIPAHLLKSRDF
jgi:uncharacterized membrane protein YjjB (DUF3815 family)